jgi:hypothetical protein
VLKDLYQLFGPFRCFTVVATTRTLRCAAGNCVQAAERFFEDAESLYERDSATVAPGACATSECGYLQDEVSADGCAADDLCCISVDSSGVVPLSYC